MINIKRPKSKTQVIIESASEHLFEIAAGLFVVMIVGLAIYIVGRVNSKRPADASVAGISTTKVEQSKTNLLNTIAEGSNYKYFFDALTKTGIYQELKDSGPFTIFVPEDSAFKSLGESELTQLFADNKKLTQLVKNHIVSGELKRLDFGKVAFMRSVNGKLITISSTDYGTLFNSAKLMSSGTEATNGIAYELDAILF